MGYNRFHAGPGIVFSFVIAGVVCVLTALVYAELASMIPYTGSTYTFTYVRWVRFVAWLAVGVVIYAVYGYGRSVSGEQSKP